MLTKDEELRLFNASQQGDKEAVRQLVEAHKPMIRKIAGRWSRDDQDDLEAELNCEFIANLPRFRPELGCRINTYLRWYLVEAAMAYHRRSRYAVALPQSKSKALKYALAEIDQLERQGARVSGKTMSEIAERHGTNVTDIEALRGLRANDTRIDQMPEYRHIASNDDQPDQIYESQQRRKLLERAIEALDDREQKIIKARQYTDDEPVNLREIGNELGISAERVRQIESRALAKIQNWIDTCNASKGNQPLQNAA